MSIVSKRTLAVLAVCGAVAGLINGLLGTGGGLVIIWAMCRLAEAEGCAADPDSARENLRSTMASAVAAIIPMSAVSAVMYAADGNADIAAAARFLPGAVIGGVAGAILLDRLKVAAVKKIFAAMLIYAGGRMVFSAFIK